jgi:hypothetical protein
MAKLKNKFGDWGCMVQMLAFLLYTSYSYVRFMVFWFCFSKEPFQISFLSQRDDKNLIFLKKSKKSDFFIKIRFF